MNFAPPGVFPSLAPPGAMLTTPQQAQQKVDTQEKDEIEQRTEELILMTGGKGPRRWRQRKKEYLKKLEQDNAQLKNIIVDLQQKISAYQAQKDIFRDQLSYFQGCLAQAAPLVFQQQQSVAGERSQKTNGGNQPPNRRQ